MTPIRAGAVSLVVATILAQCVAYFVRSELELSRWEYVALAAALGGLLTLAVQLFLVGRSGWTDEVPPATPAAPRLPSRVDEIMDRFDAAMDEVCAVEAEVAKRREAP